MRFLSTALFLWLSLGSTCFAESPLTACSGPALASPWYSTWLATSQILSAAQLQESRQLTAWTQDKIEAHLTEDRTRFEEMSSCLREMGGEWQEDLSPRCKGLPEYELYHSLIYSTIPIAYRAMRVDLALAYPPSLSGPAPHIWDFKEQVNLGLRALAAWPLVGSREPLWQSSDGSPDEVSMAKDVFFGQWKASISNYAETLRRQIELLKNNPDPTQNNSRRLVLTQLERSLAAPTREQMAFLAGTIGDAGWHAQLEQDWRKLRLKRLSDLMSLIHLARPLAALTKAVPTPLDFAEVFDQMRTANVNLVQDIEHDRTILMSQDFFASHAIVNQYLHYLAFLNLVLKDHPDKCGLAAVMLSNLSAETTNDLIGQTLVFGTFGLAADAVTATVGFLGLNTLWIYQGETQTAKLKQDLIASLQSEGEVVSAIEVFAQGHQTEMLYLNYPLLLFGGGVKLSLFGGAANFLKISWKELQSRTSVLSEIQVPGMKNSPFKFFKFLDRNGGTGIVRVKPDP